MSTPGTRAESEVKRGRTYVGGYVDGELAKALQSYADDECRGNKTLALEIFLKRGVLHRKSKTQEAA